MDVALATLKLSPNNLARKLQVIDKPFPNSEKKMNICLTLTVSEGIAKGYNKSRNCPIYYANPVLEECSISASTASTLRKPFSQTRVIVL